MSLNLYKPLGDNSEPVRLAAANQLAAELLTLLSSERTVKSKSDVDYALSRLTKGLASGRDSARPGFAVVLTEFLAALQSGTNATKWDLPLPSLVSAVQTHTTPQGHTTGPEERDYHLGRLFGLQALIRSGVTTASVAALSSYRDVLTMLFELGRKKPWLRESCAWTVCCEVKRWAGEVARVAAGVTYAVLGESGMGRSSEGVAVWLVLKAFHPGVQPPGGVWGGEMPLAGGNLVALGRILKEAGEEGKEGGQKGSWNPKLHFVWDLILEVYFGEEGGELAGLRKEGGVAEWSELWRVVVDESLFAASSSDERKFHGFLLFTHTLTHLTTPNTRPSLAFLFTKNFLRSLTNQLSDPSRYLHKAATKCARAILTKAETHPWAVPTIVQHLVSVNGAPGFDVQSKTKTVEKALCFADEDGLAEVVRVLKGVIVAPCGGGGGGGEDVLKTAEVRRQWAADMVLTVVRNGKSPKTENWLGEVVTMFAAFGHFDVAAPVEEGEVPVPALSRASQGMFRARLMSCLSQLIAVKEDAAAAAGGGGDGGKETWPCRAVRTIARLQKAEGYTLAVELDGVIEEVLKGAMKTLDRIRRKRTSAKGAGAAGGELASFELLYSLVVLQVHAGETDALGVLEELQICYDRVVKSRRKGAEEKEGVVDASVVLVEILLSFLAKPSVLLRKLATQVFGSFVDRITGRGLEAMFSVLETKESLGGQAELFDRDEDGDGEDVEMGEEDEEMDSDVEEMEVDSEDAEESDDSNSDAESESDSEDLDPSEAAKLEAALSEALGPHAATADSDDDSDMDDDAMLALDAQLATIFKQRTAAAPKSKKAESKQAKETITNFKNRVLDLLNIFAKSNHVRSNIALSASILLPLLKCARTTGNKGVAEHAAGVVREYAGSLRKGEGEVMLADEEKEVLWGLLEEIHQEAAREGGVGREKHKGACSQASLVVAKVCVVAGGMREKDVERAVGVYAKSLTLWLTDKSWRVQSGLFTDFVNWAGTASKRLQNEK